MSARTAEPNTPTLTAAAVDSVLRDLARTRNQHEHGLLEWLVRGDELQVERLCGYGSMREYGERVFGFGGRGVEDRLRVGRALRHLPRLNEAFASGQLVYTVVRELCRVATPDTEEEWLMSAEGRTATEVQRMVAGREPGDLPSDAAKPELVTRRITLELTPEAWALWKDARSKATTAAGGRVDDSGFVAEAMGAYLSGGGDRDAGRAAYQIALTRDAHGGAVIDAGGEAIPVDEVTVAMAECDGQQLGCLDAEASTATQSIPPRTRRQVLRRHGGKCAVPGCEHDSFVHIHHVHLRSEGGDHDPERLLPLCSAHHRAAHDGALEVRGTFSAGFTFFHADRRAYGSPGLDLRRAALLRDAFQALHSMSWKEREARAMLDRIRGEVDGCTDVGDVVRLALRRTELSCVREGEVVYQRCG